MKEVVNKGHTPHVHFDRVKMIDGQKFYQGEVTDEAGTHQIWIDSAKLDKIKIRNPKN